MPRDDWAPQALYQDVTGQPCSAVCIGNLFIPYGSGVIVIVVATGPDPAAPGVTDVLARLLEML